MTVTAKLPIDEALHPYHPYTLCISPALMAGLIALDVRVVEIVGTGFKVQVPLNRFKQRDGMYMTPIKGLYYMFRKGGSNG